jgi:hypothetical protein
LALDLAVRVIRFDGGLHATGHAMHCRGLEVVTAAYHQGVLLLSEAPGADGRTKLLATGRDMTTPPLGTATGGAAGAGLREAVSELELMVPGEACALRPVQPPPGPAGVAPPAFQDELHTELLLPAPRFVLVRPRFSTPSVLLRAPFLRPQRAARWHPLHDRQPLHCWLASQQREPGLVHL